MLAAIVYLTVTNALPCMQYAHPRVTSNEEIFNKLVSIKVKKGAVVSSKVKKGVVICLRSAHLSNFYGELSLMVWGWKLEDKPVIQELWWVLLRKCSCLATGTDPGSYAPNVTIDKTHVCTYEIFKMHNPNYGHGRRPSK